MEPEDNNNEHNTCTPSCTTATKTTNWIVTGGSIVNSVTFESSIDEDNETDDHRNGVSSSDYSSPLMLCRPLPDSSPCEITVAFAQKHELRQVYVRSTARVYEIYHASDLQRGNEYLCTVRCGIAARDEDVLGVPDSEVAHLASLKQPTEEGDERRLKHDSPSNTNEDGWVEVKIPDNYHRRGTKDFYEATAEIADVDPCISLTIRMLSLQNKDSVCIDEVYVFADPVDSAETGNQVGQTENLAGSSLMAMLVPTFVQLSKAQGVSRSKDKQTFDTMGKHRSDEIELKSTESTIVVSKIQQEPKSSSVDQQEEVRSTAESAQPETPLQNSNTESKPDLSLNHVEKVLEKLVSRVSRVEDLLLRFEERMLKPMNSIDARLQQVEQQVEVLSRKFQNSEGPFCVRISAPEFSCCESTENSFYNYGSDNHNVGTPGNDEQDHNIGAPGNDEQDHNIGASEKDVQDFSSASLSGDTTDLANATQPTPGLIVTAPEFSNADDEEESHELEPVTDSPGAKRRHACSIDDALASALAGFLSSTLETRKYTQALAVKAPDFSNEDVGNDRKDSVEPQPEITSIPVICTNAIDGTKDVQDSNTTSPNICLEREESDNTSLNTEDSEIPGNEDSNTTSSNICIEKSENTSLNTEDSEIPGNEVDEANDKCQHSMAGEEGDSPGNRIEDADSPVGHDMGLNKDVENGENSNRSGVILVNDETDKPECEEEFVKCNFAAVKKAERGFENFLLHNVLQFPCISPSVNFEIPILDVKFTSEQCPKTKSPLEALLAGMPEANIEASHVEESANASATNEEHILISVVDNELTGPATGTHLSMDVNYCSVLPLDIEGHNLQANHVCSNQEMSTASLI